MANIAQSVNVISPLMTTENGIVKQTTWWPLYLFSNYMRGTTIGVHVRAGSYKGVTMPGWLQGVLDEGASWLDVSATLDESGFVSVVVVNISDEEDFETELKGVVGEVRVFTVDGENVKVVNNENEENVRVAEKKWDGNGNYVFRKHSMTMLRWSTRWT
jgi:alpha-N-arabinofuranosidase